MKKDDLDYVIEALKKRDEILVNDKSEGSIISISIKCVNMHEN